MLFGLRDEQQFQLLTAELLPQFIQRRWDRFVCH